MNKEKYALIGIKKRLYGGTIEVPVALFPTYELACDYVRLSKKQDMGNRGWEYNPESLLSEYNDAYVVKCPSDDLPKNPRASWVKNKETKEEQSVLKFSNYWPFRKRKNKAKKEEIIYIENPEIIEPKLTRLCGPSSSSQKEWAIKMHKYIIEKQNKLAPITQSDSSTKFLISRFQVQILVGVFFK